MEFALAVLRELHFGKAAERLHVVQPYVSRKIREFEEELGFELFRRDRHLVAPTEAGQSFLSAAHDMMTRLEADYKRARDASRLISRRNAASFLIGYSAFVPTTLRYQVRSIQRLRFPTIHLEFRREGHSELFDSVAGGVFQAGVTFAPLERNDFEQIPLRSERLHAVFPGGHSAHANGAIRLADLRTTPLVVPCSHRTHPAFHQWLLEQCATEGFKPNIREEVSSAQEAFDLVQDGVGTAIVPGPICDGMPASLHCSPILGIEQLQLVFIHKRGGSRMAQRIVGEITDSLRRARLEVVG
jgi:DNA-binding transcriptional LysR family regulator